MKRGHIGALMLAALLGVATEAASKARPVKAPATAGHPAAGRQLFQTRCAICHGPEAAGTALAPSLRGVVGRKAASAPFPNYTPALKASGLVWSSAKLSTFLTAPAKLVPGTAMAISVPKAEERADLVAYLASLKK